MNVFPGLRGGGREIFEILRDVAPLIFANTDERGTQMGRDSNRDGDWSGDGGFECAWRWFPGKGL